MTFKDTVQDVVSNIARSGSDLNLTHIAENFHAPHFSPPSLSNPCSLTPCEITGLKQSAKTGLSDTLSNDDALHVFARSAGMLGGTILNKPTWAKAGVAMGASATDVLLDQTVFSGVKRAMPSTVCDYLGIIATFNSQPLPLKYAEMVTLHALGKLIEKNQQ